jgi:hypothetical protein
MDIHNLPNENSPAFQLSGGGATTNGEVVDALGNLIIGAFAIFVFSWSFVSMFADNMVKTCGFGFKSWSCAGFTSTWFASWIVGGVEVIFWSIAMVIPSFRPIWYHVVNIWTYAGAVIHLLPIIWWITGMASN